MKKLIPVAEPFFGKEELNNVIKAVKSGWISSKGEFIEKFEKEFAKYCGVKYGIAVSNGTAALHLALVALDIKKGDEVILPVLTYVACANAITYCNAKPIFIDSHPDYWCIDPTKIEEKISKKTKAIMAVHLYGHPCDTEPILKLAKKYKLLVIEDTAEAHGAEYKGKKCGSFGDISCFSFFGNKIITTGEGGMCLTNNKKLAEKMRILRNQGTSPQKKYWHGLVGFNYRMTNLQATIGVAQVKKLDNFIRKKRKIAKWYKEGLKDLAQKGLISLHPEMPWAKCIYWMYSILVENKAKISRDKLMEKLEKNGIETRPLFYPLHLLPPYGNKEKFPVAEELSRKGINLPSSTKLSKKDANLILEKIKEELITTSSL